VSAQWYVETTVNIIAIAGNELDDEIIYHVANMI
jgi:hypothetical protein